MIESDSEFILHKVSMQEQNVMSYPIKEKLKGKMITHLDSASVP
jgi:hypothetical protein